MPNKRDGIAMIYLIRCIVTGEVYVGATTRHLKRWSEHRAMLRGQYASCKPLQDAWDQYGERNFVFMEWELPEEFPIRNPP
jgi:predicted GIY-YIG superfamily endonuclease